MNTRRDFIRTGIFAGAGLMVASPLLSLAADGKNKLKNFGFISGIAGDAMKADWKDTLKKAAEFGFTEIEGGSNFASSPKEFLSYCKEVGIKAIASGTDLNSLLKDLQKYFDQYNELKLKYAVCYWPWLSGGPFKLDDCKKACEALNDLVQRQKPTVCNCCGTTTTKSFTRWRKACLLITS